MRVRGRRLSRSSSTATGTSSVDGRARASGAGATVSDVDQTTTLDWITAVAAVIAALATTGADVAAWLSARASANASRDTRQLMIVQTEHDAALAVDAALRALEVEAEGGDWSNLGALHNRWQDGAAVPAMRLRAWRFVAAFSWWGTCCS